MTGAGLPLFFAVPILAAVVAGLANSVRLSKFLGLAVPIAVVAAAVGAVVATADGSVLVAQVAGWPGGFAIAFVADLFSSLMLVVAGVLVTASMVFAYATGQAQSRWFVPMALMMTAGVYGAYLTADLFNLFVMVEVALLPSYVLFTLRPTPVSLRSARLYLVVNLSASTVFLAGLGAVYGATGTVNLAALAGAGSAPMVAFAMAVILLALAVKAALVPAHSWLPATYPYTSPAITALFSGLLTKIGVYALVRAVTLVYEPGAVVTIVIVVVTLASMVVGVLGALGESTIRGVLAFHMVSQVGYILVGLVLAGPVGVAAVVFYLMHHTVVKTSLFLSGGAVEHQRGTGTISRLGGVANEHRWVTMAFFLAAISLTGLPPFSGFWAKLGVLTAAADEANYAVVIVALVVSAGTLMSMLKLGTGVFWGEKPTSATTTAKTPVTDRPWRAALVLPGLLLALASLGFGLFPEPLLNLATTAGESLTNPIPYVQAVLAQ